MKAQCPAMRREILRPVTAAGGLGRNRIEA
jgi:hypothetical protein